jgi:hypothetical protein
MHCVFYMYLSLGVTRVRGLTVLGVEHAAGRICLALHLHLNCWVGEC